MGKEFISGQTAKSMKDNTNMIKRQAMVSTLSKITGSIKDGG